MPVRIRDKDKAQLEKLRSDLAVATGTQPTQQDALGKIVDFAARHRARFLAETGWKPFSPDEIRRWAAQAEDLGDWSVDQIDEIVYGT